MLRRTGRAHQSCVPVRQIYDPAQERRDREGQARVLQEITGKIAEHDRADQAERLRKRFEGEAAGVNSTLTGVRKDGAMIDVGVHGALATYRGRPAVIELMQDITEKKRAEAQIQRYVTQLQDSFLSTVQVATTLGEMRDPYTAGHQRRVADVVEAMSLHRPYRPGLGIGKALAEIERGRGTAYDVNVCDACLRLFREKGYTIPA